MVLSLVIGLAGLLGVGYLTFVTSSFILHWVAVGGGLVMGLRSFQYGLEEQPFDLGMSDELDAFFYGALAGLIGFVSFKVLTALVQLFSIVVALAVALLLIAGFFIGFPTLFGLLGRGIGFVFEFVEGR